MKALMYTEVGRLEVKELPRPSPADGEVVVQVSATGICGSDLHGFLGHQSRRRPGLVLGHETTGVVAEVGEGVERRLLGTRVAVNPLITCGLCHACRSGRQNCCDSWSLLGMDRRHGAFSEAVVVPVRNVHPLPDHVSVEEAVMIEPLANAVHLLSKTPPEAGLSPEIIVFGAGTLGACIVAVGKARGMRVRAVVEPNRQRAEIALRLGCERAVDPADWRDLPLVVVTADAVGRESTRQAAANLTARGGTALYLGLDEGPTSLDFQDLVRREVRLQCSFAYTDFDFFQALRLVCEGAVDFRSWTEVASLEQGQASFEKLLNSPGGILKIALHP